MVPRRVTRGIGALAVPALVFATACGGSSSPAASATGDAGGDASVAADGATGPGDAGIDSGNDAVADGPADASADAPSDAASSAKYSAYGLIGGLDRVVILKADPVRKLCFDVRLRTPGTNTGAVTVPAYWVLESARVWDDDKACVKGYAGGAASFSSPAQSGVIDFPGVPSIPKTIDSVNVTLTFAGGPAWAPASEVLTAAKIAVE